MDYNVEGVAEELLGTDQELSDVVGSHLVDDWTFRGALREHAIKCCGCLYWFGPEELTADDECAECCNA